MSTEINHVWSLARFTGTTTCQRCGLLPVDDDDMETMCEEQCAPNSHSWVAGIMRVHREDLETISAIRKVTCERCDADAATVIRAHGIEVVLGD